MRQRRVRVVQLLKWCALAISLCAVLASIPSSADSPAPLPATTNRVGAHADAPASLDNPAGDPPAVVMTIDDAIGVGDVAVPGQSITYTLIFTNIGDTPVTNVRLVAVVPANTHLANTAAAGWNCTTSSRRSQSPCALGMAELAAQSAGVAQLVVVVDNPLSPTVRAVVIEASVNADEVVCGECGYATHTTAVDPDQSVFPNSFNLFLPDLARRLN